MAPVVLDGRVLFRLAESGSYSAVERAEEISCRLEEAVNSSQPSDLTITGHPGMPTIRLGDQHLLTVVEADVVPGKSLEEQAQAWLRQLDAALARARAERTPAYVHRAWVFALATVLGAICAHWLLRWASRRQRAWMHRWAGRRARPGMTPAWHVMLRVVPVLGVGLVWAGAGALVTEQFPQLRGARYAIVHALETSLAAPGFTLNGMSYSAVDAASLIALVAGLWIAVGFFARVLKARLLRVTGADRTLLEPVTMLIQYGLIALGVIVILQTHGLDLSALTVPASVVGVGLGFGLQNIANNFVSGLIISFERPIQIGDFVRVGDFSGTVQRIGARSTTIRTTDQLTIIVPNARFLEGEVINWSHGDPLSRLHLPLVVASDTDIPRVRTALLDAAKAHPEVVTDPQPDVHFAGLGENGLDLELLVWTRDPRGQSQLKSDLYHGILANLRRHRIEIPVPQRTLHLPAPEIDEILGAWKRLQAAAEVELYGPNGDKMPRPQSHQGPRADIPAGHAHIAAFDLDGLVERMRAPGGLDIRDRRHLFTTYPKCFVGSEAVEWMMRCVLVSREEAVRLGRTLLQRGVIHHVLDEHGFKDERLFYRFYADEAEAGDGDRRERMRLSGTHPVARE